MQLPEPMLAKPVKRLPTGTDWWMEAKYDGWRALAGVLDRVGLWTRSGNAITQVPYIAQAILERFPAGTILDGEIVDLRTARQWNRTESILSKTRGGYQHKPTVDDPPLTYVLFDVLQVAGRDVRGLALSQRRVLLEELCAGINERDDLPLMLIHTHKPTEEALGAIMDLDFEGVVCKREGSPYRSGRSSAWVKIKPSETIDGEFTGVYDPTPGSRLAPNVDGEPQPWAAGGVRFRVVHDDGRVYEGRAAGMGDRLRAELWQHPEKFHGYVVELAHWGVQDSGALRSPQVRRLRHPLDKKPPAPPKQTIRKPRAERQPQAPGTPWMRNYAAMSPDKRRECIESLRAGRGDAYDRCVQRGGDPAAHLRTAENAARAKNDKKNERRD
jgi:ATP dependent DNA ligase domain